MSYKAYLALGSNLGDRKRHLDLAIEYISNIKGISLVDISDIYETEPVGFKEQGNFYNMAVLIETDLEPTVLLEKTQDIERLLHRKRERHWGPRTIDIDILLYGDKTIQLPELAIPHPRMFERAFVLIPLKDVLKGNKLNGQNIDDMIAQCEDKNGVKKVVSL